jgi:Smg protein
MKDSMLDVLLYIYDNFFEQAKARTLEIKATDLERLGFLPDEIAKAFAWLSSLSDNHFEFIEEPTKRSFRVYSPYETDRLSKSCVGLLIFLEHTKLIDPLIRESVMQLVAELDTEELGLEQFIRIILMVLLNRSYQEGAISFLQQLLFVSTKDLVVH